MPTGCFALRGVDHFGAKLSEADVLEIRRLAVELTQAELARRFHVSRSVIRLIWIGKTWAHIGGPRTEPTRRLGPKAHNWNGGLKRKGRYMLVRMPDHPNARKGYIRRSHWIVEQQIGRAVRAGEEVHHINHDT